MRCQSPNGRLFGPKEALLAETEEMTLNGRLTEYGQFPKLRPALPSGVTIASQ